MRRILLFLCTLSLLPLGAEALAAEADPFTLTKTPILTVKNKNNIRVAYDIKEDVWEAGIGKGLYYVRGLLEAYKSQGISEKNIKVSVVLHGATVYWLLKEDVYRRFKQDEFDFNPHDRVLQELLAHGVSVEVCNLTLRGKGWTANDLMPGVTWYMMRTRA